MSEPDSKLYAVRENHLSANPSKMPAIIAYTEPFRLVLRDDADDWRQPLEDLLKHRYDFLRLNRISEFLPAEVCESDFFCFGYDGSIVLIGRPVLHPPEDVVNGINRVLGEILLGGVFTEPIKLDDIDRGFAFLTGYVRPGNGGASSTAKRNKALRGNHAGALQIASLETPQTILGSKLVAAWSTGSQIARRVNELSPAFVLQGVSDYARHDWQSCLANLWIAVEQCTSHLWVRSVLAPLHDPSQQIAGRKDLLSDTRVWTLANRLELLFQIGVLDFQTYSRLTIARKARNSFVHKGELPRKEAGLAALHGCIRLLSIASTPHKSPESLDNLVAMYEDLHPPIVEPQAPPEPPVPVSELPRGFWLRFPSLPGDEFWKGPEHPNMFAIDPSKWPKNPQ